MRSRWTRAVPLGISLFVLLITGASPAVFAATAAKAPAQSSSTSTTSSSTPNNANGSSQGYASDTVLQIGTIVQLDDKDATKVMPATQADFGHMYGVTVDPHLLAVTVSNAALKNEVYVATSGTFNVLVSDQNGPINIGDYVTVSAVDGTAMKADTSQTAVFGRAAGNFTGKSDGIGSVTLKDTAGQTSKNVTLGIIPVAIDIRANPNQKSTKAEVPKILQRIGEAIAEKPIGPFRIYLSIAIMAITIIASIVILYSGVRNSLISIGRNPLSKKLIFRGLLEIVLTSIIILIIGLFAVYLLLKL